MIGKTPLLGISQAAEPVKIGKVEPWMADFVKERHSQEEWEAFFEYCKAGPVRRWFIDVALMIHCIFFWRRDE